MSASNAMVDATECHVRAFSRLQKELDEQRAALRRAEAALVQEREATPVSTGVVVVGQPVADVPMGKPVDASPAPVQQGEASSSASAASEPSAPPPQLFNDSTYSAARAHVLDDDHWKRLGLGPKVLLHGRFSKKHNDGSKLFCAFAAWKMRWVVLTDVDICWYDQSTACPPAGVPAAASGPRGRFSLKAGNFGDFGVSPPALTVCGGDTIKLTAKRRTHEETLWLHTENKDQLKAWLDALSQRTYRVREDKPVRRVPNPYDF